MRIDKLLILSAVAIALIGCAMTPDYSGYTNNELVSAYHKTLIDLRYRQQSYSPDLEASRPYASEKIAKLKEKMSLLRGEMFKRGLGFPE